MVLCACVLGLSTLLPSCNAEDDMQLSYQHTIQVGFYSMHTHRDTVLTKVQIWGEGREDSLLVNQTQVGQFYLNVNMSAERVDYVVKTQTLQDDLGFDYRLHPTAVSGIAGVAMEVELLGVDHTRTFMDSVGITNPWIHYNENEENVAIYVY